MTSKVQLWDMTVGHVSWNKQKRRSVFEFDKNFLNAGLDISPFEMSIHKVPSSKIYEGIVADEDDYTTYKGLPHMLSDSLPDAFGRRRTGSLYDAKV
jgi:serine/threonine-protein kinase HipA